MSGEPCYKITWSVEKVALKFHFCVPFADSNRMNIILTELKYDHDDKYQPGLSWRWPWNSSHVSEKMYVLTKDTFRRILSRTSQTVWLSKVYSAIAYRGDFSYYGDQTVRPGMLAILMTKGTRHACQVSTVESHEMLKSLILSYYRGPILGYAFWFFHTQTVHWSLQTF